MEQPTHRRNVDSLPDAERPPPVFESTTIGQNKEIIDDTILVIYFYTSNFF